jgi:hypothetical protein
VEGRERRDSHSGFAYRNDGAFDEAGRREVICMISWGPGGDVSRHDLIWR